MFVLLTVISAFSFLDGLSPKKVETQFNTIPLNVTVVANTTAILPCHVDNVQEHKVVWMNQKRILISTGVRRVTDDTRMSIERPYVRDWNLHIRNILYSDVGYYTCSIDTEPVQVRRVYLNVQVPPKIEDLLSSRDKTAVEGDEVELICNATGHPVPVITWSRKNAHGDEDKIGNPGEVLLIHNVSRYCDGIYECRADNGIEPPATRQIRVNVEFPPEVHLLNKRQGQSLGRETMLNCEIVASPQAYSIWKKNGRKISSDSWRYGTIVYEERDVHKVTLSLSISNLEKGDFGRYTCEAGNQRGRDSETMTLYEILPPTTTSTTTTPKLTPKTVRIRPTPPHGVSNRLFTPDYQTIHHKKEQQEGDLLTGGIYQRNDGTNSQSAQPSLDLHLIILTLIYRLLSTEN